MKIKWGALVTDGSGKIGGHVASKNRSGSYLRTKVTPTNRRTASQMASRGLLGSLSQQWSALTDAQRLSFNDAVAQFAKTDIFGDIKNPTGKNLFVGLNKNLALSNQSAVLEAPTKVEIPVLDINSVTFDVSANTLVFDSNDFSGYEVLVSATAPQSAGTGFYKGKYRFIGVTTGADFSGDNFYARYQAKFGNLALNDNVSFEVKLIAPTGQASVPVNLKLTTQA